MNKKNKKAHAIIDSDTYEEAILYVPEDAAETHYGEDHDNRRIHHEKRQSSRPHQCKGPECEDVFKNKK